MVIMTGTMFWLELPRLRSFPRSHSATRSGNGPNIGKVQGQDRKPSSAIQRRSKKTAASPISSLLRSASARPVARRVVIDRHELQAEGAHALYIEGLSIRSESVAETRGRRPWVPEQQQIAKPA